MIIAAIISLGEAGGSHPDDVQDWIEVGFHDVSVLLCFPRQLSVGSIF
jgi:hypothetical protein